MDYRFLRFPDGKKKAVTFSYDDGCPEDIRFADTLTKYHLKATFNFTANQKISVEEAQTHLLNNGHEIAIHCANHKAPGLSSLSLGIKEVVDCRSHLEQTYGQIIRGMAYPDAGITQMRNDITYPQIKQYLTDLNIAYARTLGGDNDGFEIPTDWHAWMPTAHHDNPQFMEYADKFLAASEKEKYQKPMLFYVWGHSFEFERKNNWEHLTEICEKLSGKEDIWYATNIEIYTYITAYRSLVWSADEMIVHNPTVHTVWFYRDKQIHKIAPGETINL